MGLKVRMVKKGGVRVLGVLGRVFPVCKNVTQPVPIS